MRIRVAQMTKIVKSLLLILVGTGFMAIPFSTDGAAQGYNQRSLQPWERELQKFYNQRRKILEPQIHNPVRETLRKLRRDPLSKLGLPSHGRLAPQGSPGDAPPALSPYVSGYDSNGDGAISRDEYFSRQRRSFGYGAANASRRQRALSKLESQFRRADIDRDGKVTAEELSSQPGVRF
ncbi:MAG: hypothetical protein CMM52_13410 [Rhodospirillaceae bacterium]|nr:hypothetical protein [Rhodospirillaceae bacterium]|tara:strand:+ start:30914 stop:31450 length:537 start_codon:yes stop_codon:yes gene_type:complete